jgi:hypothetical protein
VQAHRSHPESTSQAEYAGSIPVIGSTADQRKLCDYSASMSVDGAKSMLNQQYGYWGGRAASSIFSGCRRRSKPATPQHN